jgi:hypothetical protein
MFGEKERVEMYFDKLTIRQDKDGKKIAKMRFSIPLDAVVAAKCPPEIRAAYKAIETRDNKINYCELELVIPGVNVELYPSEDSKSLSLALQTVSLEKMAVEREESKLRMETHLLCSIEIAVNDGTKIRHWLVDNVFNRLWAKLEVSQMQLMPTVLDKKTSADKPRFQ